MGKKRKSKQPTLLDLPEWWEEHWQGMPEFIMEDQQPFRTFYIHFRNQEDLDEFLKLIDQTVTPKTKFLWYPKARIRHQTNKGYIDTEEDE